MIHKILQLHGAAAYAVIFALPALEASVFLGFLFPGEIAVLLGGVLAFQGRISLWGAMGVAIAGAIIGDSVGYAVGKRWGNKMLDGPLRRLVKAEHREKAIAFLQRHRGKAVLLGRFTAALRVLVPGLAGIAGIHYPTFLIYNVAGGVLWAGGFTLLGYVAGNGYRRVEHVVGNASLILLSLVAFVVVVVLIARRIAKHPERFAAFRDRMMNGPILRLIGRPIAFLAARFRPGEAFGLALTLGALFATAFGVAFGFLLRQVVQRQTLEFIDRPVLDWFIRHTETGFTTFMRIVTALGSLPVALAVGITAGIVLILRKDWPSLAILSVSPIGGGLLNVVVKDIVRRPRPPVVHPLVHATGSSFPSAHAMRAVALYLAIALIGSKQFRSWGRKVAVWSVAVIIAVAIGFSRMYLQVHYLTDVLGGYAGGAVWLVLVSSIVRAWTRARQRAAATLGP